MEEKLQITPTQEGLDKISSIEDILNRNDEIKSLKERSSMFGAIRKEFRVKIHSAKEPKEINDLLREEEERSVELSEKLGESGYDLNSRFYFESLKQLGIDKENQKNIRSKIEKMLGKDLRLTGIESDTPIVAILESIFGEDFKGKLFIDLARSRRSLINEYLGSKGAEIVLGDYSHQELDETVFGRKADATYLTSIQDLLDQTWVQIPFKDSGFEEEPEKHVGMIIDQVDSVLKNGGYCLIKLPVFSELFERKFNDRGYTVNVFELGALERLLVCQKTS